MTTVFTQIIEGALPGRFVWKDERAVAFLSIEPLSTGHVLVVPREEYDHWIDLPQDLAEHLMEVAQTIGRAIDQVFSPQRVGLMIQGFDVPHTHLHVFPAHSPANFLFEQVDHDPQAAEMDDAAEKIRAALEQAGHAEARA